MPGLICDHLLELLFLKQTEDAVRKVFLFSLFMFMWMMPFLRRCQRVHQQLAAVAAAPPGCKQKLHAAQRLVGAAEYGSLRSLKGDNVRSFLSTKLLKIKR